MFLSPFYQAPSTEDENWSPPVLDISGKADLEIKKIKDFFPEFIDVFVKMTPKWVDEKISFLIFSEEKNFLGDLSHYTAKDDGLFSEMKIEISGSVIYWLEKKPSLYCDVPLPREWTHTLTWPFIKAQELFLGQPYPGGVRWVEGKICPQILRPIKEGTGLKFNIENSTEKNLNHLLDTGGLEFSLCFEEISSLYTSSNALFMKKNENGEAFFKITFTLQNVFNKT